MKPEVPIPIFQVDAFTTDKPFSGNPAGVCILPAARDEKWMQGVALEMNLSETAFLVKEGDGYGLRWFTPTVEVAMCGHATLASAHALWESGILTPGVQAKFQTKSGLLTADKKGESIELNLPALADTPMPLPQEIAGALGVTPLYTGKNRFDYIILVESVREVLEMKPDYALLRKLDVRGVIVTSKSESKGYDFISRFFAPGSGIDEDPVTGSAHACLGPFWQARLKKSEFVAYQASARGGVVRVRTEGDRVYLGGTARTFFKGEIAV